MAQHMTVLLLTPTLADDGLMEKRIAVVNEAPIAESERRISVPNPTVNTWLSEWGIGNAEFPLGGGSAPSY